MITLNRCGGLSVNSIKGLLYKGYKIQWYSPGNGTVLSSHEVSLGYKNTQDPSIYVMFPKPDEEETYYLHGRPPRGQPFPIWL